MPIYEYQCKSCEHIFDVLQKMNDDLLKFCPECGEPQLKKLLSAPNFSLKGGGWYETDFKSDKQRNLADSDSKEVASKKDADKKQSVEKDAKPAAKDTSKTKDAAA